MNEVWQRAGIPTAQKSNVATKIKKLYDEWNGLRKSKGKNSKFSVNKEISWKE